MKHALHHLFSCTLHPARRAAGFSTGMAGGGIRGGTFGEGQTYRSRERKQQLGIVRSVLTQNMLAIFCSPTRYTGGRFDAAIKLFLEVATPPEFIDFLTVPAYARLTTEAAAQ